MKQLFIGLLIVAAGAGAYYFLSPDSLILQSKDSAVLVLSRIK